MKIIFSDRAYASILAETTEKIKTETGGLFLGVVEEEKWYVIEAVDPGPKSIFQVAYFEYDQAYVRHLLNKIANLYEAKLSLIGLWHRHPGSFDQFSATDDETNSKYANMRPEGAISVLVNIDPKFRITPYHVAKPCKYSVIEYEVGNHLIPSEFLKYKTPEHFKQIMDHILMGKNTTSSPKGQSHQMSLYEFMKSIYPYLSKYKLSVETCCDDDTIAERILDEIVEDVTYMTDVCKIPLKISQSGPYICLSDADPQNKTIKVCFKHIADTDIVVFALGKNCFKYKRNMFNENYRQFTEDKKASEHNLGTPSTPFLTDAIKIIRKMTRNGEDE